jgi:hypothetical protein
VLFLFYFDRIETLLLARVGATRVKSSSEFSSLVREGDGDCFHTLRVLFYFYMFLVGIFPSFFYFVFFNFLLWNICPPP